MAPVEALVNITVANDKTNASSRCARITSVHSMCSSMIAQHPVSRLSSCLLLRFIDRLSEVNPARHRDALNFTSAPPLSLASLLHHLLLEPFEWYRSDLPVRAPPDLCSCYRSPDSELLSKILALQPDPYFFAAELPPPASMWLATTILRARPAPPAARLQLRGYLTDQPLAQVSFAESLSLSGNDDPFGQLTPES